VPNANAIVAIVVRIEPPVSRSGAEMFREHPDGFSIEFEGERRARLFRGDRAPGVLEILEELRRLGAPAYVEVNPDTQGITRLLIPLVVKVTDILESGSEEMAVELEISQARHRLKRGHPDFGDLLETLRAARKSGARLVVTETDDHEIIDARPAPGGPITAT
jgi:hypothetical protein